MFKIAGSLRFMDIINESWHSLQIFGWNLKSDSRLTKKGNFFICFNDSSSKMMKNVFYFVVKALFVLKVFKFLSWLFRHAEKTAWLERLGFFRHLWPHSLVNKELQHILLNISRIKRNQAIKFGQLTEHPKRNIFL